MSFPESESPATPPTLAGYRGITSPYLNFDPNLITPGYGNSEYIFPDGGSNKHSRGRFELAFCQIGGSVMTGATIGGILGGFNGFRHTLPSLQSGSPSAPMSWSVRRSQILNYITKTGANTGNAFGVVALLYSAIGVGLGLMNENNDELNTVAAATTTGLLYRGFSNPKVRPGAATLAAQTMSKQMRLKRSLVGGLIGFVASSLLVVALNKDKYLK